MGGALLYNIFAPVKAVCAGYTENFIVPRPHGTVCILHYPSPLKNRIRKELARDLNARSYNVITDIISNASAYQIEDYNAVILLSEVQGFNPPAIASSFIKRSAYSPKIVYSSTYARINHPYGIALNKKRIDAITASSPVTDIDSEKDLIQKILERTLLVLEPDRPPDDKISVN